MKDFRRKLLNHQRVKTGCYVLSTISIVVFVVVFLFIQFSCCGCATTRDHDYWKDLAYFESQQDAMNEEVK
jgi:hypothetical protein